MAVNTYALYGRVRMLASGDGAVTAVPTLSATP